jgi:hypothetical protein
MRTLYCLAPRKFANGPSIQLIVTAKAAELQYFVLVGTAWPQHLVGYLSNLVAQLVVTANRKMVSLGKLVRKYNIYTVKYLYSITSRAAIL